MPRYILISVAFAVMLLGVSIAHIYLSLHWIFIPLVVLIFIGLMIYGASVLSAGFFVLSKCKGEGIEPTVALTFDDGPLPGKTEKVLDVLKKFNVTACFFCMGERVDQNPTVVQRMHNEGHIVGNHSYFHKSTFPIQTSGAIVKEIERTGKSVAKAIGSVPAYFRPPYGVMNPMVAKAIIKSGCISVGWSIRSFDTVSKDKSKLLTRITRSIKPGDIILLHDHGHVTAQILPELIEHIRSIGLKIVRLDDLLEVGAYKNIQSIPQKI